MHNAKHDLKFGAQAMAWKDIVEFGKKAWPYIKKGIEILAGPILDKILSDDSGAEKVAQKPSYNAQKASTDETWQLHELLEQEREKRKAQIAEFDQYMQKQTRVAIEQLKKDIAQFEQYGLDISDSFIERQFVALKHIPPMAELANRRYSITNPDCKKILKLDEGAEKKHRMKEFGDKILLEGGETYYDELFNAYETVFSLIGSMIQQQVRTRTADMKKHEADIANFSEQKEEQERQMHEIQGKLQRLANLKKLFEAEPPTGRSTIRRYFTF